MSESDTWGIDPVTLVWLSPVTSAVINNDYKLLKTYIEAGANVKDFGSVVEDSIRRIISYGVKDTKILCLLLDNGCRITDIEIDCYEVIKSLSKKYPELNKYLKEEYNYKMSPTAY